MLKLAHWTQGACPCKKTKMGVENEEGFQLCNLKQEISLLYHSFLITYLEFPCPYQATKLFLFFFLKRTLLYR